MICSVSTRNLAFAAALAVATLVGVAGPAQAGAADILREGLFGLHPTTPDRAPTLPIARYVSQEGDTFVLDRSQPRPLLKFDDSPEVWALRPQLAPRGDVLYLNDLGEPVLRATRLGGLTLFTEERPGGSAAALAGGGPPLRLPQMGPQQLLERLAQASAKASHAARRLIPFDADASPASFSLMADAATIAAEAVARLARRPDAKIALGRFSKVRLVEGRKASADLQQGVMQITIAPSEGLAGRPSSDRIISAVATH